MKHMLQVLADGKLSRFRVLGGGFRVGGWGFCGVKYLTNAPVVVMLLTSGNCV